MSGWRSDLEIYLADSPTRPHFADCNGWSGKYMGKLNSEYTRYG